jgi:hypothetical protein
MLVVCGDASVRWAASAGSTVSPPGMKLVLPRAGRALATGRSQTSKSKQRAGHRARGTRRKFLVGMHLRTDPSSVRNHQRLKRVQVQGRFDRIGMRALSQHYGVIGNAELGCLPHVACAEKEMRHRTVLVCVKTCPRKLHGGRVRVGACMCACERAFVYVDSRVRASAFVFVCVSLWTRVRAGREGMGGGLSFARRLFALEIFQPDLREPHCKMKARQAVRWADLS